MRKIRFTEHQIIAILKSAEAGISEASYDNWKAKYGGMEASNIKKIKDFEDENRRLKQMFADLRVVDLSKCIKFKFYLTQCLNVL